ncbi:helix-turn-helix domain-containing protein [Halanaerobium sp. ST460_2HS_T2]|uniref:helix-turn-helix domain-containing protein n=1 Tax=Halanaerobium sp. ST460_2HS_T2 TaxID=2183914 RepID=UPI000DF21300|nr:helix-turn-helix domain-containing protein [Halanaerobium sp. ST460_2HS_T2]RCW52484.1 helix-turn-helix protein [Halanaerobium sp. ST460_2HS_T2]
MKKSIFRVQNKIDRKLLNMINKSGEDFINSLPEALEPKDIIEIMPIGKTKVYQLLRQGRLPGHKIDGQWVIPKLLFLQWYYFGEFESKNIVKKVV